MQIKHRIETRIELERHDMPTVYGTKAGFPKSVPVVCLTMNEACQRIHLDMSPEQARELAGSLLKEADEAERPEPVKSMGVEQAEKGES